MNGGLVVISGSAHPDLAESVAAQLHVALGRVRAVRFANDNLKVKIEDNVRDADVFVIQTSCPPVADGLLELLILIDALRGASARRITAVLPYYPYVRSDKKDEPRISITARLCADLLETAGADRVLLLDLHAPQVQGFFRIPADHLTALPILAQAFAARADVKQWVVVAPDVGAAKLAQRWSRRLGTELAVIEKRRSGDEDRAHAVRLVGDVRGARALIVDDEVATADTLIEATEFVLAQGALAASAAVVHPVLSGDGPSRIRASRLDELVVTDSIPVPEDKRSPRLRVLSVAGLLASAIERIHQGRSLTELFQ
ncbi:MAG TPA: ribose-phosphate pyrophosphokinase [Polyangia bacterium]|nr:ribose-phosphate pyrophosphokinase [Polyangia bacterium]